MRDEDLLVATEILETLGVFFGDHDPDSTDDGVEFKVLGDVQVPTGSEELDRAMRDLAAKFADQLPRADWRAGLSWDSIGDMVMKFRVSTELPKSWVYDGQALEMIVRDETPIANLANRRYKFPLNCSWSQGGQQFTATIGPATIAVIIRTLTPVEIGPFYFERAEAWLDKQKMYDWLREREAQLSLRPHSVQHISGLDLIRSATRDSAISLIVQSSGTLSPDGLLAASAAIRGMAAYEASTVYIPLDAAGRSTRSSQPPLVRAVALSSFSTDTFVFPGDALQLAPVAVAPEHVERYLNAVGARDPFAAYMNYYHLMEFHYEAAWIEHCRRAVESEGGTWPNQALTVAEAINSACAILNVSARSLRFGELNAFRALLRQRLNVERLGHELGSLLLESPLEYFAKASPSFVSVPGLEFDSSLGADLSDRIAQRIYTIRCAITHTKDGHARYTPFHHDQDLAREVPLVRLVAEQLVFG